MKKFNPLKALRRRFPIRLFWQLVIAFTIIIFLMTSAIYFITRSIVRSYEHGESSPRETTIRDFWADRLGAYYEQEGNWEDIEEMLSTYPTGPDWTPWPQEPLVDYVVAAADGTIIAANHQERIGDALWPAEYQLTNPIIADGETIGYVHLFENKFPTPGVPIPVIMDALASQRFTLGLIITVALSLAAGVIVSRTISRPLANLTTATRALAAGDLSARVPVTERGETKELSVAFNAMADALARADELRRNMTADTAHELRTPLSVIRGKLEGIIDGVYPATPEHLEPVLTEVELLTHLVEDLRLLALAEAGQLYLDRRPTDIGDLLRDAQVNFDAQAEDKAITLILNLPATLPKVTGDWRRIAQILSNLISNALRHTPEGGTITLAAEALEETTSKADEAASQEWVEVTISDSGAGIPPEDLPHIFERFWRGEKSRSRASGGSGLGLSIAKHMVELHGGTISAESELDKGSTFRFTLPVIPEDNTDKA